MKRLYASVALTLFSLLSFAQADLIPVEGGEVKMTPVFHGTLVLEWEDISIFIDPYGGSDRFTTFGNPDLVLITHPHGDHLNKKTLNGLDISNTILIAPESVSKECTDLDFRNIISMSNGDNIGLLGINIEAVPMYNLPDDETSRHPKGWGNGYVVTIGGERFYFSGDTEAIPEMRNLKDIDYAFVCMNLPYTMDVDQAADGVLDFQPRVVYPYHYRGKPDMSNISRFKELVNSGNSDIEVRLRNWYPNE